MNQKVKGNIFESTSKVFSGWNANALKYIVPVWISSLAAVSCRMIFGAIAFLLIDKVRCHWAKKKGKTIVKPTRKQKASLLILGGLAFYLFQLFYLSSFKYTTTVSITVISGLNPVWTFIAGILIFKIERFSWHKVIGLILSFTGVIFILFTKAPEGQATNQLLGDGLALMNSMAYAMFLIVNKKFLEVLDGLTVVKYIFIGAAFSSIIFMTACTYVLPLFGIKWAESLFYFHMFKDGIQWIPLGALIFILIFPTVISYLLQQTGLKDLSATLVATYTNLEIIVSTVTAIFLKQDFLSWTLVLSILLMFGGLYFIALSPKKGKVKTVL